MNKNYDALALFSGGLDSILAALTIQNQGLKVKCLHYVSPFFGYPEKVEHWKEIYNLDIDCIDIGNSYSSLLENIPKYGFGSTLNPCVDCKILMMNKSRELLAYYGASFIISGEVLGQRPMSQRRDTLNVIRRDADIKDILLRPLCALHMDITEAEKSGLVKRELLYNFSGRGRQEQLKLAKELGIKEIPTPAGGCKLTEQDTSARYWQVLSKHKPKKENFILSNIGRQFWHEENNIWLVIGRNKDDNESLEQVKEENDILLRVDGFPSPLALVRLQEDVEINETILQQACEHLASYSPKAVKFAEENNEKVNVLCKINTTEKNYSIFPQRHDFFCEPKWQIAQTEIKEMMKASKINGV